MIKVLWLDDDSPRRFRRQVGEFEVITANSCAEALDVLTAEQPLPEWVIVDLLVPSGRPSPVFTQRNGLEFLAYLKENFPAVRSVVYTAFPSLDIEQATLAAGALRVFNKMQTAFTEVLNEIRRLGESDPAPTPLQPEEAWRKAILTQFNESLYSTKPLSRAARIALHTAILATTDDPERRRISFQTLELLSQSAEPTLPAGPGPDPELRELRALVRAIVEHKRSSGAFDTFLCYNSRDGDQVEVVARKLLDRGVLPWFDRFQVRPGERWRTLLEQQITKVRSALVFVAGQGIGPWQDLEIDALLHVFLKRGAPVIPVLLAGAPEGPDPALPLFLQGAAWVDLRQDNPRAIEQLLWGVTGWKVQAAWDGDSRAQPGSASAGST